MDTHLIQRFRASLDQVTPGAWVVMLATAIAELPEHQRAEVRAALDPAEELALYLRRNKTSPAYAPRMACDSSCSRR